MTTFTPGKRENVGLLIILAGGTGSGKTFTGMRLASGMSGGKPFAVIDTENRRALHYADSFKFDHADLRAPFNPAAYTEAIKEADKAGYPVIMVDSGSHVWAGDGGVLDMQEAELDRMAGDNYQKREACKMAAWIKPKGEHKRMVSELLQVRAHVILCLRAEPKIEMVKKDGKMVIQPKHSLTGLDGWIPVCDKNLPFEATLSLMFTADRPGIPQPIKLQDQHRAYFPLDHVVDESSGERLAAWAHGGTVESAPAIASAKYDTPIGIHVTEYITPDQGTYIGDLLAKHPAMKASLLKRVGSIAKIPADKYKDTIDWIASHTEATWPKKL